MDNPNPDLPVTPEELGYPEGYNPYEAQKKRFHKIVDNLDRAQKKTEEMGAVYLQFGERGRAEVVGYLHVMLEEAKQAFIEFYGEKM